MNKSESFDLLLFLGSFQLMVNIGIFDIIRRKSGEVMYGTIRYKHRDCHAQIRLIRLDIRTYE